MAIYDPVLWSQRDRLREQERRREYRERVRDHARDANRFMFGTYNNARYEGRPLPQPHTFDMPEPERVTPISANLEALNETCVLILIRELEQLAQEESEDPFSTADAGLTMAIKLLKEKLK